MQTYELAGAEGFEPPSSVLETDSLTVELTPLKQMQTLCRRQNDESYDREPYQGAEAAKLQSCIPTSAELFRLFVCGMLAATITEL